MGNASLDGEFPIYPIYPIRPIRPIRPISPYPPYHCALRNKKKTTHKIV